MTDNTEKFQPVDTTVVQVRSVLNFMYALGYVLDTKSKTGRFVTEAPTAQGNRYISVATAVKLHNLSDEDWGHFNGAFFPRGVGFQSGFTPIGVCLAISSKLVQTAKFVVTRKGQVIVQDVMIKPQNASVLRLINS